MTASWSLYYIFNIMQSISHLPTQQIRNIIRKIRRNLPIEQRLQAEQTIYHQVQQHTKLQLAHNIAIFLSFDGEVNTQPIIEYLWQQGKSVFLPLIDPVKPNHLIFIAYEQDTPLVANQFDIFEPIYDANKIIPYQSLDVIFTPLVAFDDRNYRIGMGGGYYDRLLQNYQQENIYPIGLAFKCQQIDHVMNQAWDIQLPEIIKG